jgi:hypothetical protein
MKKISLVFLLTVVLLQPTLACDVCGCSLGGNYFGILPQFNKNFVGLRWSQAKFHSYIYGGAVLPAQYSNDTYNKVELWGRYYVNEKLQVFGFIPYAYNNMNGSDQVVSAHGLGDVTLMANYLIINTGGDRTRLFKHSLMAGGGIKLPTGDFKLEDKGKIINRNFQMGTGSVDFLISAVYTVRYECRVWLQAKHTQLTRLPVWKSISFVFSTLLLGENQIVFAVAERRCLLRDRRSPPRWRDYPGEYGWIIITTHCRTRDVLQSDYGWPEL